MTLQVFTDGAALSNSRTSIRSKAGFATVWPEYDEYTYCQALLPSDIHTNNRAELHGVLHALKQANEIDPSKQVPLIIFTDSMLVINSITIWSITWEKNKWKKKDGKPVMNLDLIRSILDYVNMRPVSFVHVKAHQKIKSGEKVPYEVLYNDIADKMARSVCV